ncbi:MAG TPA: YceI family protein [Polyangia bacterium]|nr:YceI family protein [Polyangia bacterium]
MTNTTRALTLALTLVAGARGGAAAAGAETPAAADQGAPHGTYQIDAKRSRFIVETQTSGLSTMFAHDHRIEIRDFSGQATFARNQKSGSLQLTVRPKSMVLIGEDNLGARQAIESTLRDDVLDTVKFPEITFKTKTVTSSRRGDGTFDVRLAGELNLHGVKRQIIVPARVSLDGGALHAIGVFEVRQTDYAITPFSFANGTVGIKDTVTLSFDIIATQAKS